jgi:beta-lactamase regulating signal transducer with metallopeptidase domain
MWAEIDRLVVLVVDAGLAATVLLGAVAIGMVGLRQPARRLRLARAGLAGSLALIPLIGFGLVPRVEILEIGHRLGVSSASFAGPSGLARMLERGGSWPGRIFAAIYLAGVGSGLATLAIGSAALWRVKRRSVEPSEETSALYQSLPFPADKRRPLLRVSHRMQRPALLGLRRPIILIPTALELPTTSARDSLRLSLLHELAHAEAGDPWYGLLGNLARAFWFAVPPLWWIGGQTRIDQEFLADHRAALRFGRRSRYASSLIDIAALAFDGAQPRPSSSVSEESKGFSSPLFLRVLMLIRCPFPIEERPPGWWATGVLSVAALLTLSVSAIAIRPPRATAASAALHANGTQTFQVARLSLPALHANARGRVLPFELPIDLPDQFDLTLEVWAKLADLGRTRVAGLALEPSTAITRHETTGWHKVQIHRVPGELDLAIDGENIPIPSARETLLTHTLSIEPAPDATGLIRNLTLHW